MKCHILGVVLNAVDSGAPDYYYSYRYYPYSYGYGPQEALESVQEHEDLAESVSEASRAIATTISHCKEALCVT